MNVAVDPRAAGAPYPARARRRGRPSATTAVRSVQTHLVVDADDDYGTVQTELETVVLPRATLRARGLDWPGAAVAIRAHSLRTGAMAHFVDEALALDEDDRHGARPFGPFAMRAERRGRRATPLSRRRSPDASLFGCWHRLLSPAEWANSSLRSKLAERTLPMPAHCVASAVTRAAGSRGTSSGSFAEGSPQRSRRQIPSMSSVRTRKRACGHRGT